MADCSKDTSGLVPICDLPGSYGGVPGGLWGSGSNVRPAAHESLGLAEAGKIIPRAPDGRPDPAGKIGFVALGASTARLVFERVLDVLAELQVASDSVVVVNGAHDGYPADRLANPASGYWLLVQADVMRAGLSLEQVQAGWLLSGSQAIAPTFPQSAFDLRDLLRDAVRNARALMPGLRQLHLASLPYGNYSSIPPFEPFHYEQGYGFRFLLEDQVAGDPKLAPPVAPWMTWSKDSYPWCDGKNVRSDGLDWLCPADVMTDGHHPSQKGARKLAEKLVSGLLSDPASSQWLRTPSSSPPPPPGQSA